MAFSRRKWIGAMFASGAAALLPLRLLANTTAAFKAVEANVALTELFGDTPIEESANIKLKVPDIAENGAVVPVTVSTDIANVQSISIMVDANPNPLSASFKLSADAFADVSTRVKMGKSSKVRALVQTPDKIYTTSKEVKVTIGGCGG
jgi:sulfur-oxidizing protein SoxY